jgi:hypothetical protein
MPGLNMFPISIRNYVVNCLECDAELTSNFNQTVTPLAQVTYLLNLICCYFAFPLAFSRLHSSFRCSICKITSLSMREEMRWIYAWWIVAVMAEVQTFRGKLSISNKISGMGSANIASFIFAFCNPSVAFALWKSSSSRRCSPNPAWSKMRAMLRNWSVLIDLGPKALFECVREAIGQACVLYKWFWHNRHCAMDHIFEAIVYG